MKINKVLTLLLLISSINAISNEKNVTYPFKILHISFHKGCLNDFDEVAKEIGLDVTQWFIRGFPAVYFDGETRNANIYNIGHDRAKKVWNKHREFFEKFDVIVTSDTAPLSRIFIQNGWKKPLVIWVCNRFDYHHQTPNDGQFPDQEYYELMEKASKMKNVKIVPYTEYEYLYARRKGIYFGKKVIKPIGVEEKEIGPDFISHIPKKIKKEETIFLYPRINQKQFSYIVKECSKLGIKTFCGKYNGPEDLKGFKGILYFPYNASNLAMFENFQRGLIHFVPSPKFITEKKQEGHPIPNFIHWAIPEESDWYKDDYKDCFVYFDSWQDLKDKIENIDYETKSKKIRALGKKHRETMLRRWRETFDDVEDLVEMVRFYEEL